MTLLSPLRPRLDARAAPWAVWLGLLLALAGFAGLLSLSFLEPAPTAALADVSRRLQEARAGNPDDGAAAALDDAAAQLYAAQRLIAEEGRKPWRLRSYAQVSALIDRVERILDRSAPSARQPAG